MRATYQIRCEMNGKVDIVFIETRKRKIETFFNRLLQHFKKDGFYVCEEGIGYFTLPDMGAEYWICKV